MDSLKLSVMGVSSGITTILPKLAKDEELLEKFTIMIFKNVERRTSEKDYIPLVTTDLIDNHVSDIQVLYKISDEMLNFSMGFSIAGSLQKFAKSATAKAPAITQQILTQFQKSLLEKTSNKPNSFSLSELRPLLRVLKRKLKLAHRRSRLWHRNAYSLPMV